ncbi:MAG: glycosyltransferase [Candidatus Aminicenantaceae bacterium]
MKISVVVITYNEEKKLEPALKSVKDIADEIIIVDSFSEDDTAKIAKKYTKRFYKRKWVDYSDQKNYANRLASFPWIFSLDADERLPENLRKEILNIKKEPEPDYSAYSMPRLTFYLGKWIRHCGWYPDRKIRLFYKEKASWEGQYVHEKLIVDGKVKKLQYPILHFTYDNIAEHMARINNFSSLGARKLYARKKKCRFYHLLMVPIFRFIKTFILKAGFMDGYPGFVISIFHGYAIFVRYAKLKEIWKKGEKIEPYTY